MLFILEILEKYYLSCCKGIHKRLQVTCKVTSKFRGLLELDQLKYLDKKPLYLHDLLEGIQDREEVTSI